MWECFLFACLPACLRANPTCQDTLLCADNLYMLLACLVRPFRFDVNKTWSLGVCLPSLPVCAVQSKHAHCTAACSHSVHACLVPPFRFDVSKPWSLGVFLTCQVRLEQPDNRKQQLQPPPTGTAVAPAVVQAIASPTGVSGDTAAAGASRRLSNGSSGSSGLAASGTTDSSSKAAQQQQQLVMQLVDFGFVSTSATIAVREAGGSKRMEKSWEHAVVGGGAACSQHSGLVGVVQ